MYFLKHLPYNRQCPLCAPSSVWVGAYRVAVREIQSMSPRDGLDAA